MLLWSSGFIAKGAVSWQLRKSNESAHTHMGFAVAIRKIQIYTRGGPPILLLMCSDATQKHHMQLKKSQASGSTQNSATGTRTRVARVRAEYPNQLDYSGSDDNYAHECSRPHAVPGHPAAVRVGEHGKWLNACPPLCATSFYGRRDRRHPWGRRPPLLAASKLGRKIGRNIMGGFVFD